MKHYEQRMPAERFVLGNSNNALKRKRLIDDGIKEAKCERCSLSEWMG